MSLNKTDTIFETRADITEVPYCRLFLDLLKKIDQCIQADLPESERLQNCFRTSMHCYGKLKRIVLNNGFNNEAEEINFLRNIKPRFTSFTEFFMLSVEALSFVENKAERAVVFWKEEVEKYSGFCKRHDSFIRYYKGGQDHFDRDYFLSATADAISDIHSKMFDEGPALYSSKDWIVRSYFANKMYSRFAQDKLAVISAENEKTGSQNNYKTVFQDLQIPAGSFSEKLVHDMNS